MVEIITIVSSHEGGLILRKLSKARKLPIPKVRKAFMDRHNGSVSASSPNTQAV